MSVPGIPTLFPRPLHAVLGELRELPRRELRPPGFLVVEPGTQGEVRHDHLLLTSRARLHGGEAGRLLVAPLLTAPRVSSGPPFVTPQGLSQARVLGHRPPVSPDGEAALQDAATDHGTDRHDSGAVGLIM